MTDPTRRLRLLRAPLLASALCLAAPGCGFIPSQASCDQRPQAQLCTDLLTNKSYQFDSTLKVFCGSGRYSSNVLCNHQGALGGCECDGCENGKSITWMFPDPANHISTADDVKKACAAHSQPFVSP